LYVRHGAWLGAAPDKPESDKSKTPAKTRLQKMKDSVRDEFFEPDMPPIGDAGYLLTHFWQVGPTLGDSPITNTELRNYQENEGIALSPWECKTLRRLSIDYLNESHRATKDDCQPPFAESTDAARLQQAEMRRKMRAFLD
jgi:hypothetical protein